MSEQYFTRGEFRGHYDITSPRLRAFLDLWRWRLGGPVYISDHPDSLARYNGPDDESAHNVDYWGELLAVDCFAARVWIQPDIRQAVQDARQCGFTGIGVYADTVNNDGEPQVMFHLDVRPTRSMGGPAVWGRVDGSYCGIDEAIQFLPPC